MKICGIYMITSPSGKIYIGQSVDIKRRIKRYKYFGAKEQPYLHQSFNKYGFCNHKITILIECLQIELNSKEIEFIEKYNCFNSKKGMNLTSGGGQNWKISEATRKKMKDRIRLPHSSETKRKMSASHLGKPKLYKNGRKGIVLSIETKLKISKNHAHSKPMLGKNHSEETKLKISLAHKGRTAPNKRPVIDIETGITYSCKKDAAIALGINERTLKAKLLGNIKNNTTLRYA